MCRKWIFSLTFCCSLALGNVFSAAYAQPGQYSDLFYAAGCSSEAHLLAAESNPKADKEKKKAEEAKKKAAEKQKAEAKKKDSKKAEQAKASAPKPRLTAKQRKVELHGTRNTRDLGGLPAASGTYVKEGMLYRSGALCYINNVSADTLKEKGIVSVIELRTPKEINAEGKDVPAFTGSLRKIYHCPMVNKADNGGAAYKSFIKPHNYKSIAQFFKVLADKSSYPVLFHCSAGKDRTGIMSALTLELLGTPRPIIMDDYLESKRNSKGLIVEAGWLRGVFKEIDAEGGIEKFLSNRGVTSAQMKAVRANLRAQ